MRELKNLVKRMVILRAGDRISAEDVEKILESARPRGQRATEDLSSLRDSERQHIVKALARTRGVLGGQPRGGGHPGAAALHPAVSHPEAAHPAAGLSQMSGIPSLSESRHA